MTKSRYNGLSNRSSEIHHNLTVLEDKKTTAGVFDKCSSQQYVNTLTIKKVTFHRQCWNPRYQFLRNLSALVFCAPLSLTLTAGSWSRTENREKLERFRRRIFSRHGESRYFAAFARFPQTPRMRVRPSASLESFGNRVRRILSVLKFNHLLVQVFCRRENDLPHGACLNEHWRFGILFSLGLTAKKHGLITINYREWTGISHELWVTLSTSQTGLPRQPGCTIIRCFCPTPYNECPLMGEYIFTVEHFLARTSQCRKRIAV